MNLLLLTQVYPDEIGCETLRSSSVCHYWTKEWVKEGHDVTVVYFYPNYHPVFHWIASLCPHFIAQFTNATLPQKQKKIVENKKDGEKSLKIPMYKLFPKTRYSNKNIRKVVNNTLGYIKEKQICIDIIFSHFDNPILEIAGKCKDALDVPLSFVLHGYAKDIKRLYPNSYEEIINKVDVWGYRSIAIKRDFDNYYGCRNNFFICYSGVPDKYISSVGNNLNKEKGKICYVGALVKRKYPEKILIGLLPFLKSGNFTLCYIGVGALEKVISRLAGRYNISKVIKLLGYIDRDAVQKELATAEYFVMISRHETFGMVYLEAMAHGCITIASRNEGFDGIIKHGENGFLCEAGNAEDLYRVMCYIDALSDEEKNCIKMKAIETSRCFTESIVARQYLKDVLSIINDGCNKHKGKTLCC